MDLSRERISLSIKQAAEGDAAPAQVEAVPADEPASPDVGPTV